MRKKFTDDMKSQTSKTSTQPIRVEITLPGGITRYFGIGLKFAAGCALITLVSGVWGAGAASILFMNRIDGSELQRQKAHAKLVADQVTKSISEHGALAPAEKGLIQQISNNLDRFFASDALFKGRSSTSHALSLIDSRLDASIAFEAKIKARIKGLNPMRNFVVKGLSNQLPIRIEGISYFHLDNKDIFRVDVSNARQSRVESGEVIVVARYEGEHGDEIFSGCCEKVSVDNIGDPTIQKGVMYRARNGVRKHLEVDVPLGAKPGKMQFKIGVLTATLSTPVYSEWLSISQGTPMTVSSKSSATKNQKRSSTPIVSSVEESRDNLEDEMVVQSQDLAEISEDDNAQESEGAVSNAVKAAIAFLKDSTSMNEEPENIRSADRRTVAQASPVQTGDRADAGESDADVEYVPESRAYMNHQKEK